MGDKLKIYIQEPAPPPPPKEYEYFTSPLKIIATCEGQDFDHEEEFLQVAEAVYPKMPPWMEIAWEEYRKWSNGSWTEKNGLGYKRAQAYFASCDSKLSPSKYAWCGAFINYILKETNNRYNLELSIVQTNPKSSLNHWHANRYPGSKKVSSSTEYPHYGLIAVLEKSRKDWEGHVGFVINKVTKNNTDYLYLLGGNQNNKVCIQEFKILKTGGKVKLKTAAGTIYSLLGFVYPKEHPQNLNKNNTSEYEKTGYKVESAFSTI